MNAKLINLFQIFEQFFIISLHVSLSKKDSYVFLMFLIIFFCKYFIKTKYLKKMEEPETFYVYSTYPKPYSCLHMASVFCVLSTIS